MPTVYRSSTSITVNVECAACRYKFSYGKSFRASSWLTADDARQKLRGKAMDGALGCKRCPQCGYLQAWMLDEWSRVFGHWAMLCSAPLVLGYWILNYHLVNTDDMALLAIASWIGGALLVGFLARHFAKRFVDPNCKWHRLNGPGFPSDISPQFNRESWDCPAEVQRVAVVEAKKRRRDKIVLIVWCSVVVAFFVYRWFREPS